MALDSLDQEIEEFIARIRSEKEEHRTPVEMPTTKSDKRPEPSPDPFKLKICNEVRRIQAKE